VLESRGGAKIIPDDQHLGENLAIELERLTGNPAQLVEMGLKAYGAAMPGAAQKIARLCSEVIASEGLAT
jgi:UDP-N-acetylglucosamine:LPS N-acetylglucosamine transferase